MHERDLLYIYIYIYICICWDHGLHVPYANHFSLARTLGFGVVESDW
jgi:hypothetical protein